MSIVAAPIVNQSAVKPLTEACYDNNIAVSDGIFLGDKPLQFSLPLILLEISLIFITNTIVHLLLRPLGQCRIVSQIITGILLGRSVMGRSLSFRTAMFPTRGTLILDILSVFSLILFLFSIGVKTDLRLLRKPGKAAVIIGITGSVIPMALAMTFSNLFRNSFPQDINRGDLIFELVFRLSLSSFAVIADTLDELGLLNADLGRIAMSATLITDIINWVVSSGLSAWDLIVKANDPKTAVAIVVSLLGFAAFVVFVARPVAVWLIQMTPAGELVSEGPYMVFMLGALSAAFVTEITGYHATLGPLMLGLVLPGGMPLGVTMTEKLDSFLSGLFLPLYLVLAGYRTDFSKMHSAAEWSVIDIVFLVCYVGKLLGSVAAALFFKMPLRDALTVGLIMNIKGIIEVSFFNYWGDVELASAQHFSVLMVTLLLNTAITTPLVKLLYNPTTRYAARKRRTIQHSKPHAPLRLLTCVYNEDHVASILDLLEASQPTHHCPLSISLLHLTELLGRAASVLHPHKIKPTRSSAISTASDHIVNAFRYFEQQSHGAVTLHPYVALAPYSTMHNDVCSLAHHRKAQLIILPFHIQSDGAREMANNSIRSVNCSVLHHAPCSVAVLVDRSLPGTVTCTHTNRLLQRVVVYFLGGPDDREALAYAIRMAEGESICLTVLRFVYSPEGQEEGDVQGQLDEEGIVNFREKHVGNDKMFYFEKVVADGEGTVEVIRSMSGKFDLVIVGRRRLESGLTSGLSEWSECPELGPVGDMLASTDFGGKVSILVVQQQKRVKGGAPDERQSIVIEPRAEPKASSPVVPRSDSTGLSEILEPVASSPVTRSQSTNLSDVVETAASSPLTRSQSTNLSDVVETVASSPVTRSQSMRPFDFVQSGDCSPARRSQS